MLARRERANETVLAKEGIVPLDYPADTASDWPDLLDIVERRVKPERQKLADNPDGRRRKKFWWRYGRAPISLYSSIANLDCVLAIAMVSPHVAFVFLPTHMVYTPNLTIFPESGFVFFAGS